MSEEQTNNNAEPEAQPAESTQQVETFTADQVNDMVQKRLARERKKTEAVIAELEAKLEKASTKKPAAKAKQSESSDELRAEIDGLKATLAEFTQAQSKQSEDRAFAEYMEQKGIDAKWRPLLRPHFDPSNLESIDKMAAELPQPQPEQKQATFQSPGAPNASPVQTVTNPALWSRDDRERMKANGTLRENFERYFQNQASGKSVPFRARRKKG